MATDLNIRVISNLKTTEFFMLYQQDINLNVKNFKVGAWENSHIAPGAQFYTTLPLSIEAQGRKDDDNTVYKTKLIQTDYNNSYEIYDNAEGLDIKSSSLTAPTDNTMNIYNSTNSQVQGVVLKDSKPLFSAIIRPDNKLNFSINPSIYVAISDFFIEQEFFDAATLSPLTRINYEGQSYLTIILGENVGTGKFTVDYNFDLFDLA
ncbi:hypothetical protein [Clostridium felsineum]|uniref:Uncharacterized protein n=1 Tax=Clostridium felsineum TaxID=36839 RepID=A0A1S8LYS9_9CLOT|nr:hypothetical protein [Clostridium felsineum]MCR3760010.1 hypothetical protein [Clostridium felsineum]URZ04501.1 hypothetical protein CLAUR_045900 [Clostridium felsineum]URZ09062.1 hypothetical protein CLROS_044780 [Clostridium felsineum]URZ13749.1 hypothetical protein CROST_045270 [Clostridium felsineum]URZ18729.1 hypothetical protein CLFE_048170 [Clostridium felsineum DSM 794]